ncbi:MAG: VTC domain-containing protein, partial [Prolixibacteraceae bacterium]
NKKLNRYKVRRRKYSSNDCAFFEIKFKNNKKKTIKKRIKSVFEAGELHDRESQFLTGNTPFESSMLQPGLYNQFYRITLIHKERKDRCTIDLQPEFRNGHGKLQYNDLVIFELKRGKSLKSSPMIHILKKLKIRQRGLSKYCTGKALLNPQLKRNAFKPRLRYLQKM